MNDTMMMRVRFGDDGEEEDATTDNEQRNKKCTEGN